MSVVASSVAVAPDVLKIFSKKRAAGYDSGSDKVGWTRSLKVFIEGIDECVGLRGRTRIVDAGAGTGLASAFLERVNPEVKVYSLDAARGMLERGLISGNIKSPAEGTINALPYRDESCDGVISAGVSDFVPDLDDFIAETARVLRRPGGVAAVTFEPLGTEFSGVNTHKHDAGKIVSEFEKYGFVIRAHEQVESMYTNWKTGKSVENHFVVAEFSR